jgi:NADPH-dependent 2,4-dienoyl-CoA reductase/sulfur reductase-like enzyme/rhodanese-related sulfurtransferase/two-component sensor histidine kinase
MKKKGRPDPSRRADEPLFTVLSHELKSPVNTIESLLRVIADGFTGEANNKTLELVQSALAKTEEARALISDLLNLEKYSQGRPDGREVDLTELLAECVHRRKQAAVAKNIAFSLRRPPDTRIIILGDREGLGLVFGNLIDNALKYTPENGGVTVTVSADQTAGSAVVEVTDSGTGVDAEDMARLFTPFFRAPGARGRTPGTGLGLSIAKRVTEAHSGAISVASSAGRGATFTVRLPLVRQDKAPTGTRRRVVIIGGVTAGPKAAARLRRLDESCDITIIEKSEFLSYAGCGIPAYLAGKVRSPRALMTTSDRTLRDVHFFEHIKNIQILNKTLALRIDRRKKEVMIRDLTGTGESAVPYDTLVIATGARSLVPDLPGINGEHVHSLYKIEDAERIRRLLTRLPAAEVYIIGGGLIGVETAESLMATGARVTILEKSAHILPVFDPDIADKISETLSLKGVKIVTREDITEIVPERDRCRIVTRSATYPADLVILSTGVAANADLGREAGLALGPQGGIAVDEYLRTSDPDIYAAGDCAETKSPLGGAAAFLPLGSISTKMGRIAADNIAGRKTAYQGGLGTTMFRIFDTAAARTGLGEEMARHAGLDPVTVVVSGLDHAHFAAGAEDVVIKAIADRNTKRLLGAQGYGRGDVVSRIEILAVAVGRGLTLAEVFALDLGYFPAYNNPIDILQTACIVLENKIDGLVRTVTLAEFQQRGPEVPVVDVSPVADFTFHAIPGAINVPLENLRGGPFPLDPAAGIILCSTTSSRAYEAYRYLVSRGYAHLRVLEGGYIHFRKG